MIKVFKYKNCKVLVISNFLNHEIISKNAYQFFKTLNYRKFSIFLNKISGNYGIIINSNEINYGITDHIASFPIFYDKDNFVFKFNIKKDPKKKIDKFSLNNLLKTGYCLNNKTLDERIIQLSPGVIYNSNSYKYIHYEYLPKNSLSKSIDNLNNCIDEIFLNFKKIIDGRSKIFLSLSAGKDSRLIAAKLHEHNFKNVICYTYGKKHSLDFKLSKIICKKLNFKHVFLEINNEISKKIFLSPERIRYWKIYFQNNSIPNMQDFYALYLLKESGFIKKNNNYFINGQTADFLTGAQLIKDNSIDLFLEKFINKHFSLLNQKNDISDIYKSIKKEYDYIKNRYLNNKEINVNYVFQNYWEFNNRQSKFILQQQRCYEFFNQKWILPFWDNKFVNFWKNLSHNLLYDQKLYNKYLSNYDYKGLFTDVPTEYNVNHFGKYGIIIKIMANLLSIFFSKKTSYNFFLIISTNSYHYLSMGFKNYLINIKKIRNINSLYLVRWLKEKKINY